ncbi:MAG: SGNH/GDSL hydrolase family protein [Planctomycetota bacterium]|jgi:hypothetical protein
MKRPFTFPDPSTSKLLIVRIGLIVCFGFILGAAAQTFAFNLVGLGDSVGQSVQSGDANLRTQAWSYHKLVARQFGFYYPLPWIKSGPLGLVGITKFRSRLFPRFRGANLSVSGADVNSLLYDQADALRVSDIDSETDMVLFPRRGSQIEIAESIAPSAIICWIGNNDVLSAVISFDQLDASQMTPIAEFETDFTEIAQRLGALAEVVVFGNIPSVTSIAFLCDRQDLITFLGSHFGLKEGDYTSVVVMLLIKLGLDDGSILEDPNYVLDAGEVAIIQERIGIFNTIIDEQVASIGMAVADIKSLFDDTTTNPPVFFGIPVTARFLGGFFSLDAVHPSNIAQAVLANAFIETINAHFQKNIPLIDQKRLETIFLQDPFLDKDGDLKVRGRLLAGLLETLAPFLGISGDFNDSIPNISQTRIDRDRGQRFIEMYRWLQGKDPALAAEWTKKDTIEAFRHIFGLRAFDRSFQQ